MSRRNAAIGAAIGFGGAALCIAMALAMHAIHPHLPALREFILWLVQPQFVVGMFGGMLIGAGLIVCTDEDEAREIMCIALTAALARAQGVQS